jgi:hypothetical protein
MAQLVRRIDYFYTLVPDEPGAGAKVLSALKDAGVNLSVYLGFPAGGGRSQLDLVPEDAAALQKAAGAMGITLIGPKHAFLAQGDDRVGAVAELTRRLADAKVNVTAAAATAAGAGRYGMVLWVAQGDYEAAAKALGA